MTTQLGDFTGLAQNYQAHRAGYSPAVTRAILGYLGKPADQLDIVDIGAGTGIWTRQLSGLGFRSLRAVEPNQDMRTTGQQASRGFPIEWLEGTAEATGLPDACCDAVFMASSFHWTDYPRACKEFCRILRPGGAFGALWNPRRLEVNPLLVEIEAHLSVLAPEMKRVSSGQADFANNLSSTLEGGTFWKELVYLEGCHLEVQSRERYLGLWRSVNDVRVQLGPERFERFLEFIEKRLADHPEVEATYRTRAWMVRRNDAQAD